VAIYNPGLSEAPKGGGALVSRASRDGLIAAALLALPWILVWSLAPRHHLATTTVTILVYTSIPLAALWLTWADRNAREHGAAEGQAVHYQLARPDYSPAHGPVKISPRARLVIVTVLLLGLVGYFCYRIGSEGSPAAARAGTVGNSATSGIHGGGSNVSNVYTLKYNDISFTLPGGGCQNGDIVIPAWVTFTGSGPQVSTSTSFQVLPGTSNGDLELECELGDGNANPGISFSADQAADVTGTPGPSACEHAITRAPLSGGIQFNTLSSGMQFCINTASGLIARITLVRANDTTYNLTWTVTAWSAPASS
jgi:hypothetical protein